VTAARVIILLAVYSCLAGAQSSPVATSRSDSARILRGAKSAQIRFESQRRFLAPRISIANRGSCQMIGRFCRHASGLPFPEIPEEPDGTTRARLELLRSLGDAAAKLPGDNWITGQRIRYFIEAGDDSAAAEAARSCRAEQWWCDALTGLAAHASNHFVAAERAYTRALAEMPWAMRCQWNDLTPLLDGDALNNYTKLDCDARENANRRIWWLSDPLFSTPGNERRTEHFARLTWGEIDRGGANGFGMSWAADMMEMIVRFGWAEKWTQEIPSGITDGSPLYVAHEREPVFHFLPSASFAAPVTALGDSSWDLSEESPPEGYSPRYARTFLSLHPQLARFRRGDSTLLVAAFDARGDTAWRDIAVHPALVIAPSDTTRFILAVFDSTPKNSALWVTFPSRASLASLELLSFDGKVAGRWRGAIPPLAGDTTRRAISDLLLFNATDSLASDVDGAIASAFGGEFISQRKKVGVYWETYGGAVRDTSGSLSLTLTPLAPGMLTRVLRSIGVGKKLAPVDVRWREAGPGATIQPRSVLLDLSQVAPGRYELRVTVGSGIGSASAARTVIIER
jgi:hypothetical protein